MPAHVRELHMWSHVGIGERSRSVNISGPSILERAPHAPLDEEIDGGLLRAVRALGNE